MRPSFGSGALRPPIFRDLKESNTFTVISSSDLFKKRGAAWDATYLAPIPQIGETDIKRKNRRERQNK